MGLQEHDLIMADRKLSGKTVKNRKKDMIVCTPYRFYLIGQNLELT